MESTNKPAPEEEKDTPVETPTPEVTPEVVTEPEPTPEEEPEEEIKQYVNLDEIDNIEELLNYKSNEVPFQMWPSHRLFSEGKLFNISDTKHIKVKIVIDGRTEASELPYYGVSLIKSQGNIE